MNDERIEEILNSTRAHQERKLFYDRRVFTYSYYIPERRSGKDRRQAKPAEPENVQNVA